MQCGNKIAPAGFFILMIVNQSYTGELNRIQTLKRTRSAASLSSRGSSGKELSQDSFRQRLLGRDGCCLLTHELYEWDCGNAFIFTKPLSVTGSTSTGNIRCTGFSQDSSSTFNIDSSGVAGGRFLLIQVVTSVAEQ